MPEPIALQYGNNFYCSCERFFDASLIGKPVIILSNNDGCAVARSEEAKTLGINMGAPLFQIRNLVKEHGVRVRPRTIRSTGISNATFSIVFRNLVRLTLPR
ncbi:Y-family DNA polymerase [Brucella pseudogrignonensis]